MRTKRKTKASSVILFITCVLLIGLFSYLGIFGTGDIGGYRVQNFGEVITRGLDLQGGVSILQEITDEKVDDDKVNQTINVLKLRVDSMGAGETSVIREGEKRIRIEIPGKFNSNEINETVTKTGKLEFVDPEGNVVITGSDVKEATVLYNQSTNQPFVSLTLNEGGRKKFAEATEKFVGQPISIKLDGQEKSAPVVQEAIPNGQASIDVRGDFKEATELATIIQSGSLPVTLKNVETKTVGPTLGETALPLSLKAGAVGVALVFLFMLLYYRMPGLLANLALTCYILIVLLCFKIFGVVLTLPGIAGFLLTIGMAVDANVLIFERIREELKTGKSIRSSVDSGFHRALSSIVDSNITTIIAGVVLYYLGSGGVRGFALTLVIGILVSMFSAIVITKYLIKLGLNAGILNKVSYFGVKRG
jgi:protein-export membrane protein SecD